MRHTNSYFNSAVILCLLVFTLGTTLPVSAQTGPQWWYDRGVIDTGKTPDDYAPLNEGQLKNTACAARDQLGVHAGDEFNRLINSFSTNRYNYHPVNVGQLKYVASFLYGRLIELGLATNYPWESTTQPVDDYAIATIGQLKALFNTNFYYNAPPEVTVILPDDNNLSADSSCTVSWEATDVDDAATVSVYYDSNGSGLDGTLITQATSGEGESNATFSTAGLSEGSYYIYVIVNDGTNPAVHAYSDGVVQVDHNYAPSVSLTSPGNGSSYEVPRTVSLSASASDPDGNIERVDFLVDGRVVDSCPSAPFLGTWCDLSVGSHTIQARVYDTCGLADDSGTVTVNVSRPAPQATLRVEAQGHISDANPGNVSFLRDGSFVYNKWNYQGAQGFNLLVFDPSIGAFINNRINYNTYADRHNENNAAITDLIADLQALPNGVIIMLAICDEAGLNWWQGEEGFNETDFLPFTTVTNLLTLLQSLGSTLIDDYSYADGWCFIAKKGQGKLREQLTPNGRVEQEYSLTYTAYNQVYDLVDHLTTHIYYNCGYDTLHYNSAAGGLNCVPGDHCVCGYINAQHAHIINFNSSRALAADGIKFKGVFNDYQAEHMNVILNSGSAVRWQETEPSQHEEEEWQTWPVSHAFDIQQGNNRIDLKTDHFPRQVQPDGDGSVHFEPSDGQTGQFIVYTSDGDDDDDTMLDSWETYYGLDPLNPNDAWEDADGDGLNNLGEYNANTDPNYFDTDSDLLSDHYEMSNQMDPNSQENLDADPDSDGLTTFDEHIYGTRPYDADSDGDGVSDGDEVAQGSQPADPSDEGNPPPQDDLVDIQFVIGDHSGSQSERYVLHVGPIALNSRDFGNVVTQDFQLQRGVEYPVTIHHAGSNQETPDYDYTAYIRPTGGSLNACWILQDPDGLLGEMGDVEASKFNQSATLIIPKMDLTFTQNGQECQQGIWPRHSGGPSDPSPYHVNISIDIQPASAAALMAGNMECSIIGNHHGASISGNSTLVPGVDVSGIITVQTCYADNANIRHEEAATIKAIPLARMVGNTIYGPFTLGNDVQFYMGMEMRHQYSSSGGSLEGFIIDEEIILVPGFKYYLYSSTGDIRYGRKQRMLAANGLTEPDHYTTSKADFYRPFDAPEHIVLKHQLMNLEDFVYTETTFQGWAWWDPIQGEYVEIFTDLPGYVSIVQENGELSLHTEFEECKVIQPIERAPILKKLDPDYVRSTHSP